MEEEEEDKDKEKEKKAFRILELHIRRQSRPHIEKSHSQSKLAIVRRFLRKQAVRAHDQNRVRETISCVMLQHADPSLPASELARAKVLIYLQSKDRTCHL